MREKVKRSGREKLRAGEGEKEWAGEAASPVPVTREKVKRSGREKVKRSGWEKLLVGKGEKEWAGEVGFHRLSILVSYHLH